jgi:hypothetical protein
MGRQAPAAARVSTSPTEARMVPAQVMSSGRLYALQFSDGTIKVGVSASPVSRWRMLSNGKRPISAICSPSIEWLHRRAESELLKRMRRIFVQSSVGREVFVGATFGATETLLRQVYGQHGSSRASASDTQRRQGRHAGACQCGFGQEREVSITDSLRFRIDAANRRYGPFSSTHEALGVASEEWDELRAAIHANNIVAIRSEALDLAAVLIRLADACHEAHESDMATAFAKRSVK